MQSNKLKASCPICGRNLFRRTENPCIQGNYPQCGTRLIINFYSDWVSAVVDRASIGEKSTLEKQKELCRRDKLNFLNNQEAPGKL